MKNYGYSLLETLTVLSLISLLALASVFSVQNSSEQNRVRNGLSELFALTAQARQLAITQAKEVLIEWDQGRWQIAGVAQAQTPFARFAGFRPPPVRFYADGSATNGTWVICAPPYQKPRGLVLSRNGRARVTQDRDGDGRDEAPSGQPLGC